MIKIRYGRARASAAHTQPISSSRPIFVEERMQKQVIHFLGPDLPCVVRTNDKK